MNQVTAGRDSRAIAAGTLTTNSSTPLGEVWHRALFGAQV
jgi:hypothetical protein